MNEILTSEATGTTERGFTAGGRVMIIRPRNAVEGAARGGRSKERAGSEASSEGASGKAGRAGTVRFIGKTGV